MLHPGLSAHCAARDSGSLSQPSIKCRVIYCSASTTAVTARATHAAGPRESLWTSPDWYSWDRNHTCSPAACVPCNAPTSFQGLVVHCFPGTRLCWVKSLINLAHSTVSVLNKGCQLCQMWWVLYELFFFTRSTDLEKVLNYLQRLKATLLFCIETAAETDPCLWDFNFSSCMSNFRKIYLRPDPDSYWRESRDWCKFMGRKVKFCYTEQNVWGLFNPIQLKRVSLLGENAGGASSSMSLLTNTILDRGKAWIAFTSPTWSGPSLAMSLRHLLWMGKEKNGRGWNWVIFMTPFIPSYSESFLQFFS